MPVLPFAQIDAFASQPFEGNQACVMPLEAFLADDVLQAIAAENNVAETAFIVPAGDGRWALRWFTPGSEVPLCGHATLAAAHWLFQRGGFDGAKITFETVHSGALHVERGEAGHLIMDFPRTRFEPAEVTEAITSALGAVPTAVFAGAYLAAVFETPGEVEALSPDFAALEQLQIGASERGCVGCLAPGGRDGADITSRFFAPGVKIPEDPATGSWHCMVAPLGADVLGKTRLKCFQAYPGRGAWIGTELAGDRVKLSGQAVTVIEGQFTL